MLIRFLTIGKYRLRVKTIKFNCDDSVWTTDVQVVETVGPYKKGDVINGVREALLVIDPAQLELRKTTSRRKHR